MNRRFSLAFLFLLVLFPNFIFSQTRAIRPLTIQIPDRGQVELYKGSFALVIGASDYHDNAWVDLSSVRQDVAEVSGALKEHGFQVETLLDPTEDDLINQINDFIDAYGYDSENRLLFYYAGHGYTQERNGRKFGYLVPVDAPNPYDNERAFFRKSLKMEQILSWAKQIESKHALFVFDSCFSGSVLQSRAVTVPEDISYLTAKPVRQFISAGSANQTVPAISVFRPLFIRGINGQADLDQDGYVTGVELGMYLQKQVPRYQTGQTPQYGKILDPYLDEGNFVFHLGTGDESLMSEADTDNEHEIVTLYISNESLYSSNDPANWKKIGSADQNAIYVGAAGGGVPNGTGSITFPNGEKYVGPFQNGYPNGKGIWTSLNGTMYSGDVKNGIRTGQGTYTLSNGDKYVGNFKDGEYSGIGTHTYSNGDRYEGNWKEGKYSGQGIYHFVDGRSYEGNWKEGKYSGLGTYIFSNGDKYEGNWKNDLRDGQGTYTVSNGDKYVGNWRGDNYHGQGIYTFHDGRKYVGEFKNGKYNGMGTFTWTDGRFWSGLWRDGQFVEKRFERPNQSKVKPVILYISLDDWTFDLESNSASWKTKRSLESDLVYIGEISAGLPNGEGTFTWSNGATYSGEWKDGKRHGQGTYTYSNGEVYRGLWNEGKFVGDK